MWVLVRENLPVQPWKTGSSNLPSPILDVCVTSVGVQGCVASRAVVILGVEVACAPTEIPSRDIFNRAGDTRRRRSTSLPFLHHHQLTGFLGLVDVWLKAGRREVPNTIGVQRNDVYCVTVEPVGLHGFVDPRLAASDDKDLLGCDLDHCRLAFFIWLDLPHCCHQADP